MYAFGLKVAGYNVAAFPHPAAFFNSLDAAVPDLVVLDWNLPDGSGGEALVRLRRQARTARTPVFILSNYSPDQVAGSGDVFAQGALGWLVKAKTTPVQLAEKVREMVSARLTLV